MYIGLPTEAFTTYSVLFSVGCSHLCNSGCFKIIGLKLFSSTLHASNGGKQLNTRALTLTLTLTLL